MNSKFGTVKNPLTIIAIFAGTAEVSGTAILPFLEPQNQTLYVWFLMIFPLTIVIFFFITLNWNYKVLYAPSDFENEDNFVNILQKASASELLHKENKEINDLIEPAEEIASTNISDTTITGSISSETQINLSEINISAQTPQTINELVEKLGLANDEIATKEIRKARSQVWQKIQRKSMDENRLAEKMAFEKLEKELGVIIETDVKLQSNRSMYIFDGIIRQNNKLTAVEVNFFRDMNLHSLSRITEKLEGLYRTLSDEQKKDFSLIFVVVTDFIRDDIVSKIIFQTSKLAFPVAVKCYEFDKLADELIRNVA